MNYIACYDIADDRARLRIAKLLLDFGERVQKSVFEIPDLDPIVDARLLARLRKTTGLAEEDSIRLYPLCARCRDGIVVVGHSACPPLAVPLAYAF